MLRKLPNHPDIILESAEYLESDLAVFNSSNVGFADCLILNDAQRRQLVLHTFDRKLARLHGAKHVGTGG